MPPLGMRPPFLPPPPMQMGMPGPPPMGAAGSAALPPPPGAPPPAPAAEEAEEEERRVRARADFVLVPEGEYLDAHPGPSKARPYTYPMQGRSAWSHSHSLKHVLPRMREMADRAPCAARAAARAGILRGAGVLGAV